MALSMDRWRGKVAVVTGASSGIGASIAERLVKEGLQVVGLARRLERLEALKNKLKCSKGKFYPVKADISKESDILEAFKWIKDNVGPIHILVNNAGVMKQTTLINGDPRLWKDVLDTNIFGLCVSTNEATKSMIDNKIDGHIIHINSISGHRVPNFPGINVYSASKHAVTALTETLRQEINQNKLKIKITSVSPGAVATEIVNTNNFTLTEEMINLQKNAPFLQPDDITESIIYALSTPPHVQIQEITIKPIGEMF